MRNRIQLHNGNSLEVLDLYPDNSIDCIVCDPPYGISFMGKDWDKALPPVEIWEKCFKKLKPGGYILAMSATRTYHRLGVQLEDLGFIVHPMIGWIFGSGFPKSVDLSKQFDKQAGAKRKVVGKQKLAGTAATLKGKPNRKDWTDQGEGGTYTPEINITAPATALAKKWDGWKYGLQSLKPALEPIFMGQKPHLKPMTENVKKYGVGAVNVDACRVKSKENLGRKVVKSESNVFDSLNKKGTGSQDDKHKLGRFPANVIHDGSPDVIAEFPNTKGGSFPVQRGAGVNTSFGEGQPTPGGARQLNDEGSAARFFYTAKPSKKERDLGMDGEEIKEVDTRDPVAKGYARTPAPAKNNHPTVKPVKLMEYLIKLVCPPNGTVLDPFMGSGTTGMAAKKLKRKFIGIELSTDFFEIAKKRIKAVK